jgi:hypothetical protein
MADEQIIDRMQRAAGKLGAGCSLFPHGIEQLGLQADGWCCLGWINGDRSGQASDPVGFDLPLGDLTAFHPIDRDPRNLQAPTCGGETEVGARRRPLAVARTATRSPSAKISAMVMCQSGACGAVGGRQR